MKHLHTLGVAFGFKTATTCCCRRVKASDLAVAEDADCPGCRAVAEAQHRDVVRMLDVIEARNDLDELRSEHVSRLRDAVSEGPRYRNVLSPLAAHLKASA